MNKEQLMKMTVTELKVILKYQGFKNASHLRKERLALLLSKRPNTLEEVVVNVPSDFHNDFMELVTEHRSIEQNVNRLKQAVSDRMQTFKHEFADYDEIDWKEKNIQLKNFQNYLKNIEI